MNLDIDIEEARRFLNIIGPDGNFTFQTFDDRKDKKDKKGPNLTEIIHGATDENFARLKQLNKNGAGIYVTINRTDMKGRKAENVIEVRAVFIDIDKDGITQLNKIESIPEITPRLVVESSPGKYHVYWLLEGDLALEDFRLFQKHLIKQFGGDTTSQDLSRVLRLPGFLHQKYAPVKSRIIRDNPEAKPFPISIIERIKEQNAGSVKNNEVPASEINSKLLPDTNQSIDLNRLSSALKKIPAESYKNWITVLMALKQSSNDDPEAKNLAEEWSKSSDKYDPGDFDKAWESIRNDHPSPVTIGTIFHMAKENGWPGGDSPQQEHNIQIATNEGSGLGSGLSGSVELLCADSIVARPIEWLWPGWLAAGKLHVLAGTPGTGKTTCAYSFAATITTGGIWPDKTKCAEANNVLIWSGEDAADDTIVPRLKAAGADLAKVHIIQTVNDGNEKRPFDPATDITMLHTQIRILKPKLLIIDSIVSAVSGDSHKNTETRRGLQPLVDLGDTFGVAILGISHFTKGTSGKDPLERVTGSLAFGALARIVWAAAKLPAGNQYGYERIFARVKSNIGPDGNGFGYALATATVDVIETVKVVWEGNINGNAQELLAEAGDKSALSEAKQFLLLFLAKGEQPAKNVKESAKAAGITGSTLERAKSALNIRSKKGSFNGAWIWMLPT